MLREKIKIGVVCDSQRRFARWCQEHPAVAGVYDTVKGESANACRITTAHDYLQAEPGELIYLEPTFDVELHSLLANREFEDKPPIDKRKRPGRPAKSKRKGAQNADE